jgi:hypothetical protein
MVAVRSSFPKLTPAEYLEWEVYAMTGGTVNHSEIAANQR